MYRPKKHALSIIAADNGKLTWKCPKCVNAKASGQQTSAEDSTSLDVHSASQQIKEINKRIKAIESRKSVSDDKLSATSQPGTPTYRSLSSNNATANFSQDTSERKSNNNFRGEETLPRFSSIYQERISRGKANLHYGTAFTMPGPKTRASQTTMPHVGPKFGPPTVPIMQSYSNYAPYASLP